MNAHEWAEVIARQLEASGVRGGCKSAPRFTPQGRRDLLEAVRSIQLEERLRCAAAVCAGCAGRWQTEEGGPDRVCHRVPTRPDILVPCDAARAGIR